MNMAWTQDDSRQELNQGATKTKDDFAGAARKRWQQLAEELRADVGEFNARRHGADFLQLSVNQFCVSNSTTGLQLTITADFEGQIIRYAYEQVNDKSTGVPDGGILSMRESEPGAVEFYSADEQLTAEETRGVLLEPVLFPPAMTT